MSYFNSAFWAHHFKQVFIRELRAFERAIVNRVMPAFDALEDEAEAMANEEYERLGSRPATDDADMGDVAEKVQEAGLAHYETLTVRSPNFVALFL